MLKIDNEHFVVLRERAWGAWWTWGQGVRKDVINYLWDV